jgi:hypothetical protein
LIVAARGSEDLQILANVAQSVDFDFDKAWPSLDEATERLEFLRSLKHDRGFSKENRKKLIDAINSLHAILLAPSPILNNTPDLFKPEFKDRLLALTGQYIQFSVDAAPRKYDAEKEGFLLMVEDKLIKPIRGQPSLWGHHSLQITRYISEWDAALTTTRVAMSRADIPSAPVIGPAVAWTGNRSIVQPAPTHTAIQSHPNEAQRFNSVAPRVNYQFPQQGIREDMRFMPPAGNNVSNRQSDTTQLQEISGFPQSGQDQSVRLYPLATHRPTPIHPGSRPLNSQGGAWEKPSQPVQPVFPPNISQNVENGPPRQAPPDPRPEISRHPAYLPEMTKIYGEIPPPIKTEIESDDEFMEGFSSTPPKRPLSVDPDDPFSPKRQRTETGVHFMESDRDFKDRLDGLSKKRSIRRSLSRQEMYHEIAKEHDNDNRFLAENTPRGQENETAPTPILTNEDEVIILPRRAPIQRSKSRADEELEEELTPAIREMMTPIPREGSPDRDLWKLRPASVSTAAVSPTVQKPLPSHIRQPNAPIQMQLTFLPPGNNALGAKSPEFTEHAPKDVRLRFEHSPSAETVGLPTEKRREMLPMPKSANEMPGLMAIHDRMNKLRPIQQRDFYLLKRMELIANGSEWTKRARDGMIRLGRYFYLGPEEIDEASEYLHYLTGHEVIRPKTMIRLTCRPRNGEQPGENNHAWPDHTMVFLNGKSLITSMVQQI